MEIYITHAKRTAIGSFMGSLSTIDTASLGATVISSLLRESGLSSSDISEVIMGNVLTGGLGQNPARNAAMKAGIGCEIPAFTVGKVCGSGLKAVELAAQSIFCGNAEIVIAGGQENMSRSMHGAYFRSGARMGNMDLIDQMLYDGLTCVFSNKHMGITAENIARKYAISREMQDEFAYESQKKASNAQNEGRFHDEIVHVQTQLKKDLINFASDEFIRHDTSLEKLSKLKSVFEKDGTVTAGNSSGINDGAAAVIVASKDALVKYNLTPIARIVSFASSGVDPDFMGTGPISSSNKALQKAGWKIADIDLVEANEAYAAQAICVMRNLGLDKEIVNVNGGSIAIGHPIGASGARIFVTLLHEMKKRRAKKGLATLCIGGGMGISMCVEGV